MIETEVSVARVTISKYKKIEEAHKHSACHRDEILNSERCGCFYCETVFPSTDISEWIDEDESGIGQTALCPKCDIDSVFGDKSGLPLTTEFLLEMHRFWFS